LICHDLATFCVNLPEMADRAMARLRPGTGKVLVWVWWLPVTGYRWWMGRAAASAVDSHSSAIVKFYIFATSVARSPFFKFSTSALSILATRYVTNSLLSTLLNAETKWYPVYLSST